MLKGYFTVEELAEVLDVYKESVREILNGTLQLEADELINLVEYKGISADNLLG